jgi:hypothetical protein
MNFYFKKFKSSLPVVFPFAKVVWKGIYGLQIKHCFFGVIIGGEPWDKELENND